MRRAVFWAGIAALVIELVALVAVAMQVTRLYHTATALRTELAAGTHALTSLSTAHLDAAALAPVRAHFAAETDDAKVLLACVDRWAWLLAPAQRQSAAAAEVRQTLATLAAANTGGELAVGLLDALPRLTSPGGAGSQGARLLQRVEAAQPTLTTALVSSANLDRELTNIRGGRLQRLLQPSLDTERRYVATAQAALRLALIAPRSLGQGGPVSYLVVAQNPADLRPTGGYMGSWGVVTVDHGAITSLDYRSYRQWENVEDGSRGWPVQTPPVQKYLGFCCMDMQDANWYPDFPTTALVLEQFSRADQPLPIAGVIAVDPALIQALLGVTGPVELSDLHQTVTADNVVDLANYYEGRGPTLPPPDVPDKQFLIDVAQALAQRLTTARIPWLSLATALPPLLDQKHVLIAANDPDLAGWLRQMGWDGAVTSPPGDYFLLDEMSMSDNKVDLDIARAIDDQVRLAADGSAVVTVRLDWQNQHRRAVDPDATSTAFRDYFRVYLPPGTELQELTGVDDAWPVGLEGGHTVVSGFLVIPQSGSRQVTVRYRIPAALVASGRGSAYVLHVQLQPGIPPPRFHLSVLGPDGTVLINDSSTLSADRSWQVAVASVAIPAPRTPASWDRRCAALELVAGVAGPASPTRLAVPADCLGSGG